MWRYIDHRGTFWPLSSLRERYTLTQFPDNQSAQDWAIKNIGLILIGVSSRSIRIRLRPAIAPGVAIAAVLGHLTSSQDMRVSISVFDGEWRDFVCPTAFAAVEKLARLTLTNHAAHSSNFRRRRLRLDELVEKEPLSLVLAEVNTFGDDVDVQELGNRLSRLIANRVIILEAPSDSERLVISYVGQGFGVFDSMGCECDRSRYGRSAGL